MIGLTDKILISLKEDNCSIRELSKNLCVSEQTIRNRINKINSSAEVILNTEGILKLVEEIQIQDELDENELITFLILVDEVDINKISSIVFKSEKTIYRKVKMQKELILNKKEFDNFLQAHIFLDNNYPKYNKFLNANTVKQCHQKLITSKYFTYDTKTLNQILQLIEDANHYTNTIYHKEAEQLFYKFYKFLRSSTYEISVDEKTKKELFNHIINNYVRYKFKIKNEDILSLNIFQKYKKEYKVAKFNFKLFFDIEGFEIKEQDCAYLFALLLKNIIQTHKVVDVAIFCHHGVASSYLIKEQLTFYFTNFNCIYAGKRPKNLEIFGKDEIIIINVGDNIKQHNVINISSKFTKVDIQILSKHLRLKEEDKYFDINLYYKIKNILKKNITYDKFVQHIMQERNGELMLKDLVRKEMIQKRKTVDTWEESIRICSKPLLQNGYITKHYVDSIINNVIDLGTYIILIDGFALPHSKPEDGSLKLGMSMLVLKEKIKYPGDKEVGVIMTLSSANSTSHLSALADLTKLLEQDNIIDKLMSLSTVQEIYEVIENV